MERAANGGDLDLEQEFKDAAMKLLRELKEKHFEGTGTLLKKVHASVRRTREELRPQDSAASARPASCGRRLAADSASKRRRPRKEDCQEGSVEVAESRRRPGTARGAARTSRSGAAGRARMSGRDGAGRGRRGSFSSRGTRGCVRGAGARRAARGAEQRRGTKPAKRGGRA